MNKFDKKKRKGYLYAANTGRMGNHRSSWYGSFYCCNREKIQMLLNFMIRIVLGGIGIIYANDFFTSQGIAISVGLNPVSLLTIGILGIGGFALLYGILACKFL